MTPGMATARRSRRAMAHTNEPSTRHRFTTGPVKAGSSGRCRQLFVVGRRTPLTSPLGNGGTQAGERVGPEQGPVDSYNLAFSGDLEAATLPGDDLVHAMDPLPGHQPSLAIQPGMANGTKADAVSTDDDLRPFDEKAVEKQAEAECEAASHRDGNRGERIAVGLGNFHERQNESQSAGCDRHSRPEDDQPIQRAIRPKAHWCSYRSERDRNQHFGHRFAAKMLPGR